MAEVTIVTPTRKVTVIEDTTPLTEKVKIPDVPDSGLKDLDADKGWLVNFVKATDDVAKRAILLTRRKALEGPIEHGDAPVLPKLRAQLAWIDTELSRIG